MLNEKVIMIYFRPYRSLFEAPTPRTAEDHELYAFLEDKLSHRLTIVPDIDYEDWMEPVTLLAAALRLNLDVAILPAIPLPKAVNKPDVVFCGTPCPEMFLGRQLKSDPLYFDELNFAWPPKNADRINHYGELESFQKNAGRALHLAHFPGEPNTTDTPFLGTATPGKDLDAVLADMPETVIVKQVWPAKAFPVFEAKNDGRSGTSLLMETMDFHLCRFEGDQNALLIQEKINMRFETRLFVVDGTVVTGSGVIEAHTPQDNVCVDVNPFFEETRNDGTRLVNHELGQDFRIAGDAFAQKILEECGLDAYVLDVALNDDNEIIIIELNPIPQAGLYGANADLLMESILTYATRQTETPQ